MFLRYPAIHFDKSLNKYGALFFVADETIWRAENYENDQCCVSRMIFWHGVINSLNISSDGSMLAFCAKFDTGFDIFLIPSEGGNPVKLTQYNASFMQITQFDQEHILFISDHESPVRFGKFNAYKINIKSNVINKILDDVQYVSVSGEKIAVQRHGYAYGRWNQYQGGAAGQIWVKNSSNCEWERIDASRFNCIRPVLANNQLFYLSDEGGVGNVYSENMPITDEKDYYIHDLCAIGDRLYFSKAGKLFFYCLQTKSTNQLNLNFNAHTQQTTKRLAAHSDDFTADQASTLTSFALNKKGKELALVNRGQAFTIPSFVVNATRLELDNINYLIDYMGENLVITQVGLQEKVIVLDKSSNIKQEYTCDENGKDFAHIVDLKACDDKVAIVNSRSELIVLENGKTHIVKSASQFGTLSFDWSRCGRYLAYSATGANPSLKQITILDTLDYSKHIIEGELCDCGPIFSDCGRYLYFLSNRGMSVNYDQVQFQLNFNKTFSPYVLCLQKDAPNPFKPWLNVDGDKVSSKTDDNDAASSTDKQDATEQSDDNDAASKEQLSKNDHQTQIIDFNCLHQRCHRFPVAYDNYVQLISYKEGDKNGLMWLKNSKTFTSFKKDTKQEGYVLEKFDFAAQKVEEITTNVQCITTSFDKTTAALLTDDHIQICEAGKAPEQTGPSYKQQGIISWKRIPMQIDQKAEFKVIYDQAFAFMKEQFCSQYEHNLDYQNIYNKYLILLPEITARSELNFIISQMKGEFKTSHAYIIDQGDVRIAGEVSQGYLGAKLTKVDQGYKIDKILESNSWSDSAHQCSPLIECEVGDIITHIDGVSMAKSEKEYCNLEYALKDSVGQCLKVELLSNGEKKYVYVNPIASEGVLYYQQFVADCKDQVQQLSKGDLGYVHVPDMDVRGYKAFCKDYLKQYHKKGMIIDLRYNGGGHISPLIINMLSNKANGSVRTKYETLIEPAQAAPKVLVFLCNELTGSDGDIMCQRVKELGLGTLIGTRTWGGVVGILVRNYFIDGGMASQPEYAIEFNTGEIVENKGIEPDIEVVNPIECSQDLQLQKAVEIALEQIAA